MKVQNEVSFEITGLQNWNDQIGSMYVDHLPHAAAKKAKKQTRINSVFLTISATWLNPTFGGTPHSLDLSWMNEFGNYGSLGNIPVGGAPKQFEMKAMFSNGGCFGIHQFRLTPFHLLDPIARGNRYQIKVKLEVDFDTF